MRCSMFTVKGVQALFEHLGLTANEQVIRRWCREGTLKASKENRYKGLMIEEQSVYDLLEKKLKIKAKKETSYKHGYDKGFSDAKKIYSSATNQDTEQFYSTEENSKE